MALFLASEASPLFVILLLFFVHEFFKRCLGLSCDQINIHQDNLTKQICISRQVGVLDLTGLEWTGVMWFVLAAEVKSYTYDFADFVYL